MAYLPDPEIETLNPLLDKVGGFCDEAHVIP